MAGINEFIEKLNQDEALQKKLAAVADMAEAVKLINEEGFEVSEEEIAAQLSTGIENLEEGELSDDDLDNVGGGLGTAPMGNLVLNTVLSSILGTKKGGMMQSRLDSKSKVNPVNPPYANGLPNALMSGGPDYSGKRIC